MSFLARCRQEVDRRLTQRGRAHTLSLTRYALHSHTIRLLDAHARGRVLDAGSGRSPYKPLLRQRGLEVLSIDVADRAGEVDILGDLQDMPAVASGSVDTVLCTQVLEHLPRPWQAMAEFARVLRPGGVLVLSTPHLSAVHEAPHDFYRYTSYGLRELLAQAGLEPIEVAAASGLIAFLAHPVSYVLLSMTVRVPLLREIAWLVNYLLLVRGLGIVDRLVGLRSTYPCDHVLAARKAGP
jgi:2-polyprenyl-3-methyl-5-hydroxy-6-metoxy-1,4-benzoquinol methylase